MDTSEKVVEFPHVCIIESPNSDDILDGRKEGSALSKALTLGGIRNKYYFVTSANTLQKCLTRMISDTAIVVDGEGVPQFPMLYIHFSAHGNEDGIGLTNGEFIQWSTLGDALTDFARQTERLFPEVDACIQMICFSVCYGVHGIKMAHQREVCPFYGVIGSHEAVGWSDSLTAFVTLYHNVCHKGVPMDQGVNRMNSAIGSDLFHHVVCTRLGFEGGTSFADGDVG